MATTARTRPSALTGRYSWSTVGVVAARSAAEVDSAATIEAVGVPPAADPKSPAAGVAAAGAPPRLGRPDRARGEERPVRQAQLDPGDAAGPDEGGELAVEPVDVGRASDPLVGSR